MITESTRKHLFLFSIFSLLIQHAATHKNIQNKHNFGCTQLTKKKGQTYDQFIMSVQLHCWPFSSNPVWSWNQTEPKGLFHFHASDRSPTCHYIWFLVSDISSPPICTYSIIHAIFFLQRQRLSNDILLFNTSHANNCNNPREQERISFVNDFKKQLTNLEIEFGSIFLL